MGGVAQLEDYNETLYHVTGATGEKGEEDSKYLIATSEQPICGFHMNEWFHEKPEEKPVMYGGIPLAFERKLAKAAKTSGFSAFINSKNRTVYNLPPRKIVGNARGDEQASREFYEIIRITI